MKYTSAPSSQSSRFLCGEIIQKERSFYSRLTLNLMGWAKKLMAEFQSDTDAFAHRFVQNNIISTSSNALCDRNLQDLRSLRFKKRSSFKQPSIFHFPFSILNFPFYSIAIFRTLVIPFLAFEMRSVYTELGCRIQIDFLTLTVHFFLIYQLSAYIVNLNHRSIPIFALNGEKTV
jgi:hypothetical protein